MYSYGTSVLFVCRLCKASFQIVDDFIAHKKEEHFVEFRTSNCIVFEDILILNTNNDEEKNCGMLSTVTEKSNPVLSTESLSNAPLVEIKNNLTDVNLSHSPQHIPHDPADAFDPFSESTSNHQHDDNHDNFSEDDDQTSDNTLQPHDYDEVDSTQASADVSFNVIVPKTELTEFKLDQKINRTASNAFTQGPQNPYVLLKKLSSKEILNYSRLQNQQDTIQAAAEMTFNLQCKLCLEKFNSEAELQIHCRVCDLDNNERHLYCYPCKMVFNSKWAQNIHRIKLHGTEEEKRKLCKFKCNVCQKVYMKKDSLINHMESHKEISAQNKPFKCDQCNASFFSQYNLSRHQSSHSLARPFQCPQSDCGKAFKFKEHLQKHSRCVHSKSRKSFKQTRAFNCDTCCSSFVAKQHLRLHQASHGQERPFQCTEPGCGKAFKRKEYFTKHLKFVHSNILELFKCPEPNCTSMFKHPDNFRRHLRMCRWTKQIP